MRAHDRQEQIRLFLFPSPDLWADAGQQTWTVTFLRRASRACFGWRVGSTVQYVQTIISLASSSSAPRSLRLLRPLLHFQPQQTRLRAADGFGLVSILSIERIAAFVERIDLGPALGLVVGVLRETVCEPFVNLSDSGPVIKYAHPGLRTSDLSVRTGRTCWICMTHCLRMAGGIH